MGIPWEAKVCIATFIFLLKNEGDSMKINYIYCYENKINGHKYIGQTNNIKVRYSAHKSQAFNPNSKDYNCLFHKKIREYGLQNFDFYVLEEIIDKDDDYVDYREQFWIEKEQSWCRNGNGYNENSGGSQFKRNISITDEEIAEIKTLLKTTELSFQDIATKYNTYRECIARINNGRYGYDNNENYPIRVTRDWKQIPQSVKEEIADLLKNTKIPYKEIAKKYQISEHSINKINLGQSNLQGDYTYPLRKANQHLSKEQEQQIYDYLQEGKMIKEIATLVGVSKDTVSRRKKKYGF